MARTIRDEQLKLTVIINGDEAKKELLDLEQAQRKLAGANKELREEKKKLEQAGQKESARYKEVTAEIKSNTAELQKNDLRMEELRNQIGITGLTLAQLQRKAKELRLSLRNMTPGSAEFKRLQAELQQVNAQMSKLNLTSKATGFSIGKMADGFNRYLGIAAAFSASIIGTTLQFRKLIEEFNAYEKAVSGLSALTGLQGEQLEWLSMKAKEMSTSTVEGNIRITKSAKDIVDAYTVVGSKMPELLQDQEALNEVTKNALILAEAGNIDLAQAVDALTNTMNQFLLPAEQAAEVINQIAAGAKYGAADIDFIGGAITRFGSAANAMGLDVTQSVALIEVLGKAGLDAEKAGTGLKTFLLRSAQQADEFNVSVVGLDQALHNLKNANLSAAEMTKMFGTEAYVAAQSLVTNLDIYDDLITKIDGTTVAFDMAAVNTANNAAKLEQARNRAALLRMELGEKLAPALTFSTNSFSYLVKAIMASIEFFGKYGKEIIAITMALTAYTIAVNASSIAFKVQYYWLLLVEKAQKLLSVSMKATPWGLAAAAVAGLITWLALYKKELYEITETQKAADRINKAVNDQYDKQAAKITLLTKQIENGNLPLERRRKAIEEMKSVMPGYNAYLDEEGKLHDHNAASIETYLQKLKEKITLNVMEEEMTEMIRRQLEATRDLEEAQNKLSKSQDDLLSFDPSKNPYGSQAIVGFQTALTDAQRNFDNAKESYDGVSDAISNLSKEYEKLSSTIDLLTDKPNNEFLGDAITTETIDALTEKITYYRLALTGLSKDSEDYIRISKKLSDSISLLENLKKTNLNNDLEKELKEREKLLQYYYDSLNKFDDDNFQKSLTRDQQELLRIDQKYEALYAKAEAAGQSTDELQLMHAEELDAKEKEIEERLQNELLAIRKQYKLIDQTELMELEIAQLIERNEILLLTEEDLQTQIQEIRDRYAQEKADKDQAAADLSAKIAQEELNKKIEKYQKYHDLVLGVTGSITTFQQAAMNRELAAAGDNEEKKEQIRKEYARKQQLMAAVEAVVQGALGIVKTGANLGYPLAIPFQIVQGLQTIAQIALIKSQQFATGKYDVIGATDGKTYRAGMVPQAATGIYPEPTLIGGLGLVGERAPELVVDGPTLRNIQMNAPEIIQAIHAMRVPQYAAGNITQAASTSSAAAVRDPRMDVMIALLQEVSAKLDKPTRAMIAYHDLEDTFDEMEDIKNSVRK